jgi:hypothetical protein
LLLFPTASLCVRTEVKNEFIFNVFLFVILFLIFYFNFHRIYKSGPKLCKHCHGECKNTCNGPGPGNCTACKHVRDGPFCTKMCPDSKFTHNGECKPCHENCVYGCQGPENTIGLNGCHSCEKAIINGDVTVVRELYLSIFQPILKNYTSAILFLQ